MFYISCLHFTQPMQNEYETTVPKTFYFPIFPCAQSLLSVLTVHSLALSAPFRLRISFTVHLKSIHLALTVCPAFTYRSVPLRSFSFENSKVHFTSKTSFLSEFFWQNLKNRYIFLSKSVQVDTQKKPVFVFVFLYFNITVACFF